MAAPRRERTSRTIPAPSQSATPQSPSSQSPSPPNKPRRLLLKLFVSAFSLILTLGAVELFFRAKFPIGTVAWPGVFNPEVGWTFTPGETVRYSNFLDYAVSTPINSLGFLDREPERVDDPEVFRIALLGDSFVEAAQVEIEQKLQVILEQQLAGAMSERAFRTYAFGYSGCGTSNVLPFYTEFARATKPHLVLLVFVSNDFANNSPLLESVRNGWHPYHPPRLFHEVDGAGVREIAIDPKWADSVMPVEGMPTASASWSDSLFGWSRLHRFIKAKIGGGSGPLVYENMLLRRTNWLRDQSPEFAAALEGWDPLAENMDYMFFAEDMPKVFDDALQSTRHAFDRLHAMCREDGARLMVLLHEGCSNRPAMATRTMRRDLYRKRIEGILDELEIEHLDLFRVIAARGKVADAHFAHDGHWSPSGHSWVAQGVAEHLLERRDSHLRLPPR